MLNPVADRTAVRLFRERLSDYTEQMKQQLVERTNDRAAGYIQGLQAAASLLDEITKEANNPQRQER